MTEACRATNDEIVCSIVSGDSLQGQLVNSQGLKKMIYLCTYLLASFHRSNVNHFYVRISLVPQEQMDV